MKNKKIGGSYKNSTTRRTTQGSRRTSQFATQISSQFEKNQLKESRKKHKSSQRKSSQRKSSQKPLNFFASVASELEIIPEKDTIPTFIRYIPIMSDGRMLNANGVDIVAEQHIPIPPDIAPVPPQGPIPPGVQTLNVSGSSKKVFFHSNSDVAYITSTLRQMERSRDTNNHFREELILTQIENFLFPDILGAHHVGRENDERIRAYKRVNPDNIFIYKKLKVIESEGDSPGIVKFMIDSIHRLSHDRMSEPIPLCFVNLDIKPENIGILPNGRFIYLDNGSTMLYNIPYEFREYYENAALIIGLCNLCRKLENYELDLIRLKLTRSQLYKTFNRELTPEEKLYITEYARQFFIAQGLPLTAAKNVKFPKDMMNHYCYVNNTTFNRYDYTRRFDQVIRHSGLNLL